MFWISLLWIWIALILNGESPIMQLLIILTVFVFQNTARFIFTPYFMIIWLGLCKITNINPLVDKRSEYLHFLLLFWFKSLIWRAHVSVFTKRSFNSSINTFERNDSKRHMCHFVSSTFACKHFRRYFYINFHYDRVFFIFKTNFSLHRSMQIFAMNSDLFFS